jgi:hypothetical protein
MQGHASPSRAEWPFVALVLTGGLALRLLWLLLEHGDLTGFFSASEAQRVALTLAQTGHFADAYFAGQGPTAHILPISTGIAGSVLWLFGPYSSAASVSLLVWSLAQTGGAYLLLRGLFRALDADPLTLRWGLALLCLVPPFVTQEVIDFRYWESALAVLLSAAALVLLIRADQGGKPRRMVIASGGALVALIVFVSPSAGLAAGACWGLMALFRWPWRTIVLLAGSFALCLALMVVPWAMRNARELGVPVLLRSNAGLELAIANHPAALSERAPERVFSDRVAAIHPAANPALRDEIRKPGGEVRYSRHLGEEARAWIAAHPGDFARLYLQHMRQFFFPEPWQFYFSGWEGARTARSLTIALVSLLGIAGLAAGLIRRPRRYWIPAVYIAVIALSYAPFQPMARYIYLTYGMLAFLAVDLVVVVRRRLKPRPQLP